MRRLPWRTSALVALCTGACAPDLDLKASRVVSSRVVGVRSTPAEVTPGAGVEWDAIVVTPLPTPTTVQVQWAMCEAPRSPADSITVTSACLAAVDPNAVQPVLTDIPSDLGTYVRTSIPSDACRRIGPEVPQTDALGNRQRAPDADITGGYQLPIRLLLADSNGASDISFDRQRVRCNLANAPGDAARDYAKRYQLNQNPEVGAVVVAGVQGPADGSVRVAVPRGAALPVAVQWLPTMQERYVAFEPSSRTIQDRVENLEISWYTNGGELERDRTTPDADVTNQSSNTLRLDRDVTQTVTMWVLLRDDRGGVGVATLLVEPS